MEKNPYPKNSPEWQLWENMMAYRRRAIALTGDIERAMDDRARSEAMATKFEAALETLRNDPKAS